MKRKKRAYVKRNAAYWTSRNAVEMAFRRNAALIRRTHPEVAAADARTLFVQQVRQTMANKGIDEKAAIKNVLRSRLYNDNSAEYEARWHHKNLMEDLSSKEKSKIYRYGKKHDLDLSLSFKKMGYIGGKDKDMRININGEEYFQEAKYSIGDEVMTVWRLVTDSKDANRQKIQIGDVFL